MVALALGGFWTLGGLALLQIQKTLVIRNQKPNELHTTSTVQRRCLDGQKRPKIFAQYPSYRIFERMHGAFNVGKKIN
jgi:hypothetical protein